MKRIAELNIVCLTSATLLTLAALLLPRVAGAETPAAAESSEESVTASSKRVRLGFKFGSNFAKLTVEDSTDQHWSSNLGLSVAGVVVLPVSQYLSVQPELWFSRKVASETHRFLGVLHEHEAQLDFIEAALLGNIGAHQANQAVRPCLFAGPYLAILTRAESAEGADISDQLSGPDGGLVVGAGLMIHIGAGRELTLEGRYEHGLFDIQRNDDGDLETGTSTRTRAFNLSLGLLF